MLHCINRLKEEAHLFYLFQVFFRILRRARKANIAALKVLFSVFCGWFFGYGYLRTETKN